MSKKLRAVAQLQVTKNEVSNAKRILTELANEVTTNEAGCISFVLLQNTTDETKFTFVEEWQSEEALQIHMTMPHTLVALEKLTPILAGPSDLQTYYEV